MEDDITLNGEEETLNSKDKLYTSEEVKAIKKELASNSEKGVQKLIQEKKILLNALEELREIALKSERLIELAIENPAVADVILKSYFNETLDEYKNRIGYTEDYYDPEILRKKIENESEEKANKKLIERSKKNFIKKLAMSDLEKDNFLKICDYLLTDECKNIDDIDDVFEKAYLISIGENNLDYVLTNKASLGKVMTINGTKGSSKISKDENKKRIREEVLEFYKKHGVI